jgi:hypothetical protein
MFSSRRLKVKDLKIEDLRCDLLTVEEQCDDCRAVLPRGLASQIIGGRLFCIKCAPWYREQKAIDDKNLELDLRR